MQFSQLYGDELDRELGSADRQQLFTLARRKAAINAGQLEWVKRTECLQRQVSLALVDDTQEYDLEATISDFLRIAKQGPSIQIVSSSGTRYIEGDDLVFTSVERLNAEEPGWRAVSAGAPTKYYLRRDGGQLLFGLHPKPSVSGSDTWTALIPCVTIPTDLSADSDEPFTVSGNALASQRPYHRALAYWAAHDLEQYRKDIDREVVAFQKFEGDVQRYLADQQPKGGQTVRLARDYRGEIRRGRATRLDPRVWP